MKQKVFVGLSGGVDSATSAYLLKKWGYRVTGVYMKNWTQDIGSHTCPWREDYLSAKEVATFLNIDFQVFDFQNEYRQSVVDYMIEAYKRGLTPNPDIMCNQEIKFKLFLDTCLQEGADLIATGHYAKVSDRALYKARDELKDQTYFLYRISKEALGKTLFPLGDYLKSEVRQIALKNKLPNAQRSESMGICFVGEVGLSDFLSQYVDSQIGDIVDDKGLVVGQHKGAIFYTIGQRHGLNIGGGLPYYVTHKDMSSNIIYVSRNLNHPKLWSNEIDLIQAHYLEDLELSKIYSIRVRHGGELISSQLTLLEDDYCSLRPIEPIKALAAGQSTVIYDEQRVVGGGIITI